MNETRRFLLAALAIAFAVGACNAGSAATAVSPAASSATAASEVPVATAKPAPRPSPRPTPTLAPGILRTIRAVAPGILAATEDMMWVEGHDRVLGAFDPDTDAQVVDLIEVPTHCDIDAGAGAVWATDAHRGVVTKVDPATRAVLGTIELATPCGIKADDHDLWIVSPELKSLLRYDPETLAPKASIALGPNPFFVATGPEGTWAAGESTGGTTYRVDPDSGTVLAEIPTPNPFATGLEVGFGSAWVPARDQKLIYRIDPGTNAVVASISTPFYIGGIAIGSGAIWVADWGDGMVHRLDPATNLITGSLTTGYGNLGQPLEAFGSVWVGAYDRNVILRLDPAAFS